MEYTFRCYGHPNIRAKHYKTLEFTQEAEITTRATCVLGVRADFEAAALKRFTGQVEVALEAGGQRDSFTAIINPDFNHERELVFRRSRYNSPRTLGWRLSKSALKINRRLARLMREPATVMTVTIRALAEE